jgi:hypothetical protein
MDFGERFHLPNPRFVFLGPRVVSFITETENRVSRATYVDSLALLHDLLITASTVPEASMFHWTEVDEDLETAMLKLERLNVADEQRFSRVDEVLENLRNNRGSAFTLFRQSAGFEYGAFSYRVRFAIDTYIDDLLKQYRINRHPHAFASAVPRG